MKRRLYRAFGQKLCNPIVDELPGLLTNVFRGSSRRQDRAVIGVSMGGYGALGHFFAAEPRAAR